MYIRTEWLGGVVVGNDAAAATIRLGYFTTREIIIYLE